MSGILSEPIDPSGRRRKPSWPRQEAELGLVVRHRTSGCVGSIVRFSPQQVKLRDRSGREHTFPVADGAFSVEGRTVSLVRAKAAPSSQPTVTASGSLAAPRHRARQAVASRILVEGIHDAELVEKIWGDDLRGEGVVVEPLHGADDLGAVIDDFNPSPQRRLGILLDHLVDYSKESRIAASVNDGNDAASVLITGHDFVDIWAAVKPAAVGIDAWPEVPMGTDWKQGVCDRLGFKGTTGEFWRVIQSRITSYRDLDPSLVGAVEQLIDFVAPPPPD